MNAEHLKHGATQISTNDPSAKIVASRIDGLPASLPLVSAIIPAYNAAEFVRGAIESALAQSHRLLEIILVDDGSNDETAVVAAEYPITVIRQVNGGPASARNTGVKVASGEWIAFLDHDDSWHRDKTEQQMKYAQPDISAVFSRKTSCETTITFADMFARNYGGNPSSTIIRAEVLRNLEMFDDDPALKGLDDYNFWLRFMLAGYAFATTQTYYDFTPAENHYGGDPAKMLSAEIVNIDKIAALASLDTTTVDARKRQLILRYMPDLIAARKLSVARQGLRTLGFDKDTAYYFVAFLPEWLLNFRRYIVGALGKSEL